MSSKPEKIEIENFTSPGQKSNVDKVKYEAMRKVLLATLPDSEPGVTYDEMKAAILPHLSEELWPGGEKVGWWLKAVHLDLEAKGIMRRIVVKPLRYLKSQEPH